MRVRHNIDLLIRINRVSSLRSHLLLLSDLSLLATMAPAASSSIASLSTLLSVLLPRATFYLLERLFQCLCFLLHRSPLLLPLTPLFR